MLICDYTLDKFFFFFEGTLDKFIYYLLNGSEACICWNSKYTYFPIVTKKKRTQSTNNYNNTHRIGLTIALGATIVVNTWSHILHLINELVF